MASDGFLFKTQGQQDEKSESETKKWKNVRESLIEAFLPRFVLEPQ
jgi:hypothetical protein